MSNGPRTIREYPMCKSDDSRLLPDTLIAIMHVYMERDIYMTALVQVAQNAETLAQAQDIALFALHSKALLDNTE